MLSPTKLHLLDFYIISSYKITDVQCSCKVFTEGSTESIWIAVKNESGGSNLLILNFQVDGSRVNPQVSKFLFYTHCGNTYNYSPICSLKKSQVSSSRKC